MRSKILILCTHPKGSAPSQRFRFEQYLTILKANGFDVTQESFFDEETRKILYSSGYYLRKLYGVIRGITNRIKLLFRLYSFNYVFIHLEACPIGPPIIEAIIFALKIPVIYDIDDAIFMKRISKNSIFRTSLKWPSKIKYITKHSFKIVVVNKYLSYWAKTYNHSVFVIPTTIDPIIHKSVTINMSKSIPIIGWTGTHSTAPYLDLIRIVLLELQKTHQFIFHVICNVDPKFDELSSYKFIKWNKESEFRDLSQFDIGIMPVPEIPWAMGKVGFKAIQYGALGIPSVVSNVGSSSDVVRDGVTGYVVKNNSDQWCNFLKKLIDDRELREKMGKAASTRILDRYSKNAQSENYIKLFSNGVN